MTITTKHARSSPVTFVTQQRFAVTIVNREVYTFKTVCTPLTKIALTVPPKRLLNETKGTVYLQAKNMGQ